MLTKLIRIGNSRGVRLPKAVIDQAHLGEDLDIEVRGDSVVIRPAKDVRQDWASAAAACRDAQEDDLADWDAAAGDDWA